MARRGAARREPWMPPALPEGAREPLGRGFFARPTAEVARDLIGRLLVRAEGGRRSGRIIVEAEAYVGEADTACHASHGKTRRNAVMYGAPGHAYVYFTYGMHWMLNAVTEPKGAPGAALIRAIEPVEGLDDIRARRAGREGRELTAGPARVCAALAIDGSLNGTDLVAGTDLRIEAGIEVRPDGVEAGERIGIDYAAPRDRRARWRFWLRGNAFVSR
jgi:DNA-3-methyladenine glycosylase